MDISEPIPLGELIQQQVNLAIAQNSPELQQAVELARKAGVGVYISVHFNDPGGVVVINARPEVRVPAGEIWAPDFSKFNLKGPNDESESQER